MVALVRDNSLFGMTSPIYGGRARFEIRPDLGDAEVSHRCCSTTGVLHAEASVHDRGARPALRPVRPRSEHPLLVDLYAGYPELVHGYGLGSFDATSLHRPRTPTAIASVYNNLRGSRLLVTNVEVRAPLMGLLKGELELWQFRSRSPASSTPVLTWSCEQPPSLGRRRSPARAQRRRRRPRQLLRFPDARGLRRAPVRSGRGRTFMATGYSDRDSDNQRPAAYTCLT